jgi:hypothetical protein
LATQLGFGGGVTIPGVRARNGTRGANRAGVGTDEDGSVMESYGRETMLSSAIADERAQGTKSRTGPNTAALALSYARRSEDGGLIHPCVRRTRGKGNAPAGARIGPAVVAGPRLGARRGAAYLSPEH